MTGRWCDPLQPGSAPPALLRARVLAAEEVLILNYTADLRFFERVALTEARAAGARVTVVHDAAADLVPPDDVHHAGVHYTDVPVRCRSNGEFHPKLLVVAGADRTLVAIGSGNATASGWHHNGELWTTIAADRDDWPGTFHDLAAWLRELPQCLYIDQFGAERVARVAETLDRHPVRTPGPRLMHNLRTSIAGQLPLPAGRVTNLVFASPFLDNQAAALRRLTSHFDADSISYAVTVNAAVDPDLLAAWAGEAGAALHRIKEGRHFHGKLVQWRDDDGTHALVGSANITAAGMLRTTGDRYGNCELGLLCRLGNTTLEPSVGDQLKDADAVRDVVAEPHPETARDIGTPRLLRVLLDGPFVLVTVVADAAGEVEALLLADHDPQPLHVIDSHDRVHRYRAENAGIGGAVCYVRLVGGALLGPVRVTDAVAVDVRPGTASPFQGRGLADVLSDRRLSDQLFQALKELAAARPATTPRAHAAGTGDTPEGWRQAAERTVGSALVRLALGRADHEAGEATPTEDVDPGDVVDEAGSDDDGIDLFDDEDHDTGVRDLSAVSDDPVTRLLADPVTAARLANRVDALVPEATNWHAGALLALMRVTLLVAAGGGWHTPERAAESVSALLRLLAGGAGGDEDVAAARRAAILVGLAAITVAVERWDDSTDKAVEMFEQCRALTVINPADIDRNRVAHYAEDLYIGFGTTLLTDSLLDAAGFLLTSTPIERAAETLGDEYHDLALVAPRLLRIRSTGNPYGAAMRLLTRLGHLAPVAVHAVGPRGGVYAAWHPKTFILQRFTIAGTPVSGSRHRLAVGPGAHVETPPGAALDSWRGPLPLDLVGDLRKAALLA